MALLCCLLSIPTWAGDWPMWRHDAGRTAATPDALPEELHLLWVRQYEARTPVWDDPLNQDLMHFDEVFEPIVLGNTLFIGFNDADKVVALDTETGEEKWAVYCDGPVRLPMAASQDALFFTSDDGRLYCLNAQDGTLRWQFDGAPNGRKVIGNKRLISTWPARGGCVLDNGVVFFAASIWPFMGTFLYALDTDTGAVRWINDGNGLQWMLQPHNSPSFAGVAPQGAFVLAGDALLVPGGRSVPACFDRNTGTFLHYLHCQNNKTGGAFVCADGDILFNHHREDIVSMYEVETGKRLAGQLGRYPVLDAAAYYFSGPSITAVDAQTLRKKKGNMKAAQLWEMPVDASGDLIKAGPCLYAGSENRITAVALDETGNPSVAWNKALHGKVKRLLAADNKLFAVTLDGQIMAFGPEQVTPRQIPARGIPVDPAPEALQEAHALLAQTGVREGYALLYGIGNGDLPEALVASSQLRIVVVEPDPAKVEAMRRRFDAAGLLGERLSVLPGTPHTLQAPPYMASLTLVNDPLPLGFEAENEAFLNDLYNAMRPYGGIALVRNIDENARKAFAAMATAAGLFGLRVSEENAAVRLVREGPLEGAADWTHYLGDLAQSGKSDDARVRLPLGLLWFGGSSNLDVLTRHGHGPPEQVVGGRLFIQGMHCMSARDVYTGRVLWKRELHDLGTYGVYYDETYKDTPTDTRYNQVHIPGANTRGINYVVTEDKLYVIQGSSVHVLDGVTGNTVQVITLPPLNPQERRKIYPPWGFIGVYEQILFGGAGFVAFSDLLQNKKAEYSIWEDFDKSASKRLLAMNRHTGDILWEVAAQHGFLHNGTAGGNDTLFTLDKLPPHIEKQLARRGQMPPESYRLLALDVNSGDIRWSTDRDIFGSFLCYSEELDILLQSTRPSRDSMPEETGKRIIAYRGATGEILWDERTAYSTFPLLHGTNAVTEGRIFNLNTGESVSRNNPLTGEEERWRWERNYGCNYPIASEHLLTFRSGAAGFCDFDGSSGTGNFGGFKSSCTSNLIAANGVLNAPDYTRTCSCSYQNQTSLAMVHDPYVEYWTYNNMKWRGEPIRQLGVNFGAAGDRQADNGTLWLEFPLDGGPSPDIPIQIEPDNVQWLRHHSARLRGEGLKWVAASGVTGVRSIRIALAEKGAPRRSYTVRLHFAECDPKVKPGDRVFDVTLQGRPALQGLDLLQEAGAPLRPLLKEFKDVRVRDDIEIGFAPAEETMAPLICGVEVLADGW